jgi:hypothetical protein
MGSNIGGVFLWHLTLMPGIKNGSGNTDYVLEMFQQVYTTTSYGSVFSPYTLTNRTVTMYNQPDLYV